MQYWYAVYTKPHKERQVERVLAERGIGTCFPTLPAPHRRCSTARAFFPCYVFAHADLDQVGLWSLHYAPGARGVVMFGGIPARVDDGVIAALRERLARADPSSGSAQVALDARGEFLERGDRVKIISGPLVDMEALFDQRLSAAGRVRVLVHLLRRWTKVEVDADALKKM